MKKNRCLNFLKGIACLGVLLAHCDVPGIVGDIILRCVLWTVPIFYMISGYYSYNENNEIVLKKIPKKIKNITKITLLGSVIYFLYMAANEWRKGKLIIWLMKVFYLQNIFNIFVWNNFDFMDAGHFWFLLSLIYCYILLYLVIKHKKINIVYYSVPILCIIRILVICLPTYNYHYQQNFLLGAVPSFFTGYFIASHLEKIPKIKNKTLILTSIAGLIISLLDVFFEIKIDIFEIGIILLSLSLFLLAQNNPNRYINKFIEKIGVKYSLFIYIMHILIIRIFSKILGIFSFSTTNWYPYTLIIIMPIITLIIAILFYRIIENNIVKQQIFYLKKLVFKEKIHIKKEGEI